MSLEAAVRAAIPADVAELLRRLRTAGFAAYVVGGALRDVIAGRAPVDWDLATDATPDALRSHFPDARYENRFGTVGIPTAAGLVREVTTFRVDGSSSDARRPDAVRFIGDLRGDLDRRDFTINAIAFGLARSDGQRGNDPVAHGVLVDPHGGASDLAASILRAVGDPDARFREDALRMLRAARFAARFNLTIDPLTAAAIRRDASLAPTLHKLRSSGKKLFLLTNSRWAYTDKMMTYLLHGAMSEYPAWRNFFDVVIAAASLLVKRKLGLAVCWVPGGYPELHARTLSHAHEFLNGLRRFAEHKPVHGECGGYMVLGQTLTDAEGHEWPMANLLSVKTSFAKRKMTLGYRDATLLHDTPLGSKGAHLRGHEFHYATIIDQGVDLPFATVIDAYGSEPKPSGSRRGFVTGSFFHAIAETHSR